MAWNSSLTNLRDVLAELYETQRSINQMLDGAGFRKGNFDTSGRAKSAWHDILAGLQKNEQVEQIIQTARQEYPNNKELKAAADAYYTERARTYRLPDVKVDSDQLERIIGPYSTLLPANFLKLGGKRSDAVAKILRKNGDAGTGFLIDNNLLVTSNHVLPTKEEAAGATVQFNYQKSITGLDALITPVKLAPHEVFETSEQDDWTVVKIKEDANAQWGKIPIKRAKIKSDDRAIIIQHPGGYQKQIGLYHNVIVSVDEKSVEYLTDTSQGSSGSPVFNNEWDLIAIHRRHTYRESYKTHKSRNSGIHINVVIDGLIDAGLCYEDNQVIKFDGQKNEIKESPLGSNQLSPDKQSLEKVPQLPQGPLHHDTSTDVKITMENQMDPEVFIVQKEVIPLIKAMQTFTSRTSEGNARRDVFIIAEVDHNFINRLSFNTEPFRFANALVAEFRQYSPSQEAPDYHPMVKLLEHFVPFSKDYGFNDQQVSLFEKLIKRGNKNLKGLAVRRPVGRIDERTEFSLTSNLRAMRKRLNNKFNDEEFDAFCLDYFTEVHNGFGRGMSKNEKITKLMDHCRREATRWQKLLTALEEIGA